MPKKSWLLRSMATVLVAPLLAITPVTATADAAQLIWAREATQFKPNSLLSQVDGDVTAGQCSPSDNQLAAKDYPASGSLVVVDREIHGNTNPRLQVCSANRVSVVDKNGDLYTLALSATYKPQLAAYKMNIQKWLVSELPHSCTAVKELQIGANGNLYAALVQCGPYGSTSYLVGFKPDAQPGASTPEQVLDVQVDKTSAVLQNMASYDHGLVLQYSTGVQYYGYDSSNRGFVTVAHISNNWQLSPSANGRVFLPILPNQAVTCPSQSTSVLASVVAIEPSGQQWSYPLPACTAAHTIVSTYSGGAVLATQTKTGTVDQQHILSLNTFGQQVWNKRYNSPGGSFVPGIITTLNGDVALQGLYRQNDRYAVKFALLSGVTGEEKKSFTFFTDAYGYNFANQSSEVTIAKNRAYLLLYKCYEAWSCGGNPTLYALSIPGLEMDYPRGAILRAGEPELELVALGDSFSSGQGAGKYLPGTEASASPGTTCRQSKAAYGYLLDASPTAHLKLKAFKACGGATTADVIYGHKNGDWVDKPEQLSALSASTDVVTITVGGNDVGFTDFVAACIDPRDRCDTHALAKVLNRITDELPNKVQVLFHEIQKRVGAKTRIYVIGYPMMISSTDQTIAYCSYLSSAEKAAIKELITKLNQALAMATQRAGSSFKYIEPAVANSPFQGHELCEENGFFNGAVIGTEYESSFHPKGTGHEAYKRLIEPRLN